MGSIGTGVCIECGLYPFQGLGEGVAGTNDIWAPLVMMWATVNMGHGGQGEWGLDNITQTRGRSRKTEQGKAAESVSGNGWSSLRAAGWLPTTEATKTRGGGGGGGPRQAPQTSCGAEKDGPRRQRYGPRAV